MLLTVKNKLSDCSYKFLHLIHMYFKVKCDKIFLLQISYSLHSIRHPSVGPALFFLNLLDVETFHLLQRNKQTNKKPHKQLHFSHHFSFYI